MTNFDKIKSMDIDELGELFANIIFDCPSIGATGYSSSKRKADVLQWLESEIEKYERK